MEGDVEAMTYPPSYLSAGDDVFFNVSFDANVIKVYG